MGGGIIGGILAYFISHAFGVAGTYIINFVVLIICIVLITEKYFRGSNAKGATGSGLGLYLAKSFMEQMCGSMECHNDGGFVVTLFLQKV